MPRVKPAEILFEDWNEYLIKISAAAFKIPIGAFSVTVEIEEVKPNSKELK